MKYANYNWNRKTEPILCQFNGLQNKSAQIMY